MKKPLETSFEQSAELKRAFNQYAEAWCRKYRLGMSELAERCGVSQQYLAHVGRYGRIPGKPILTLLALNLEVPDPAAFFRLAKVAERWPYEPGLGLRQRGALDSGLLSVNLDMNGFTTTIREIIRAELRPKTLDELLGGRALRVGLNLGQSFLFDSTPADKGKRRDGFFPELIRVLALAMRCEIEFSDVLHTEYAEKLQSGVIDLYGPVYFTPQRIAQALYSTPFCSVRLGAIGRTKAAAALAPLPQPKRVSDLRKREYQVTVHRDSMSHHFALSELGIPPERLIACDLPEETVERIVLSGIPRPAHVLLTDAPHALKINRESPETQILFTRAEPDVPPYEDAIALRGDWAPVLALLDETLAFLKRNGSLERLQQRLLKPEHVPGVLIS